MADEAMPLYVSMGRSESGKLRQESTESLKTN